MRKLRENLPNRVYHLISLSVFVQAVIFNALLLCGCRTVSGDVEARTIEFFRKKRAFGGANEGSGLVTAQICAAKDCEYSCLLEYRYAESGSLAVTTVPLKVVPPWRFQFVWKGKTIPYTVVHFAGQTNMRTEGLDARVVVSMGELDFEDAGVLIDYLEAYKESTRNGRLGCLTADGVFFCMYSNPGDVVIEIHRLLVQGRPVPSPIVSRYVGGY